MTWPEFSEIPATGLYRWRLNIDMTALTFPMQRADAMTRSIAAAGAARIIITRFNLYVRRFRELAGLNENNYLSWCEHRAEAFLTHTLPSLTAQPEKQRATVLLYFDVELNEPVERVLKALQGIEFVRPILFDMRDKSVGGDMLKKFSEDVLEHASPHAPYIVTTRMDTDDMLAPDFSRQLITELDRIPHNEDNAPQAVSMPYGAQWDGQNFYAYLYPRNPFISFVEARKKSLRTVYSFPHYDVHKHAHLHFAFSEKPSWLQIVHDRNAANHIKENLVRLNRREMKDYFRISPSIRR